MTKELKKLIEEFKIISKKGFIESINNSFGSVGLTFEKQLNKNADSMFFPDYYGTELKCTSISSHYPLFLFTIAFDGPTFPEINRIVENFGYPDKDYPDKKVLFEKANNKQKITSNSNYRFNLEPNLEEDKLYLAVYDKNSELIEKTSFVYLSSIKDHLLLKLNQMALVYSATRTINNRKYYKYFKMEIYKLKNFEIFLKLLEAGDIEVDIISRISKSGNDAGRYRNKNLVFKINKAKIWKLFNRIYSYRSKI